MSSGSTISLNGRDVTSSVGIKGGKLDGNFEKKEQASYIAVVTLLFQKGIIDADQKDMFIKYLSKGCERFDSQTAVGLHLREVLVAYMESPEFQKMLDDPKKSQDPKVKATITLATELAIRMKAQKIKYSPKSEGATARESTEAFAVGKGTAQEAKDAFGSMDYNDKCATVMNLDASPETEE